MLHTQSLSSNAILNVMNLFGVGQCDDVSTCRDTEVSVA